ncbi:hypothetical protein BDA99DRAFT_496748 [Phascolomyces articulosus]|uniref:HCP-like protein n=1 Tax=Phascolomyces articulosus TaxID=60185 RepID=A0AAD5KAI0_9FUNG|nr:hypothetical protein BDA99DRAFT_496748 [Phascolomyces articulosus]
MATKPAQPPISPADDLKNDISNNSNNNNSNNTMDNQPQSIPSLSSPSTTSPTTNTTTTPTEQQPPKDDIQLPSMESLSINDPSLITTDPTTASTPHSRSPTPQSQSTANTAVTPPSLEQQQQQKQQQKQQAQQTQPPLSTNNNNTNNNSNRGTPTSSPRLVPPQINVPTPSSSPRMMNPGPPPEPPQHSHMHNGMGPHPPSSQQQGPPPPPPTSMMAPHPTRPLPQQLQTLHPHGPPPMSMPPPQHLQQQHFQLPPPGPPGPPPPNQQQQQFYQPVPVGLDPAYMYHRPQSFYDGGNGGPPPPMQQPQPHQLPPFPPQQQQQFMQLPPLQQGGGGHPWRNSYHVGMVADNEVYLPDSSLLAASTAGRRPKESQFPPPTLENLNKFRREAKTSNNPQQLLDMAKYILEAVPHVCRNEKDPKRKAHIREALTTEAYKTVKKLANTSGIGKSGYAEAQYFLAMKYMHEDNNMGLKKDADKGYSLFMQGAKQNHAGCNYRVAVCYEVGAGTKKDKGHAIQYYRKAANLGDPSAMYKLGMILLKGLLGQSKNPREGISWLKRATQHADQDLPHAFHELGLAYEKDGIPSVIADVDYSRELFTQAAQYGYAPSQFKLGLAYENGFLNCPIDPRRSIAWYSKAAEQGHLESELSLSGWYLTGAEGILKQSDSEAYLWARKAADRGYAKAEYAVGYYTETGIGVRQNLEDAKKWYMRAASQQNRRAIQRLAELKKAGKNKPKQRLKHTRPTNGRPDEAKDDCIVM